MRPEPRLGLALGVLGAGVLLGGCHTPPPPPQPPPPSTSPMMQEGFLPTSDGARLFYRSLGNGGDTIVVVHGGPGLDMNYLVPGLAALADGRTLVFYDQRATGRSEGNVDSVGITLDRFIADLEDVRVALGLERLHLLGHSCGGLLATTYTLAHPQRVGSLVLVSSIEPGRRFRAAQAERQRRSRTEEDSATLARLMTSEGVRAGERAAIDSVYWTAFRATFHDRALATRLDVALTERTARVGSLVAASIFGSMGAYDYWDALREIRVPTLIVHGDADPIPVEVAREMHARIPPSTLNVMPDAGHFPQLEAPDAFTRSVRQFWDRLERN